jgi:GT2 family glycosyltransferase
MIKPITFCIATAKNERDYIALLLKSLKDNTDINKHEILIFVDSDNQNTYDMLLEQKSEQPNIRICKNSSTFPIGSQRNVSVMFNAATNDIVCYLQSDMVVGKNFDEHITSNIDENTVLSCARIEPPLHPASPEKIVMNFGIIPEEFKYNEFNQFVDKLQKENRPNILGHFAPFAIYKKTWFDKLGGFDTQFRCSREDSDTIIRMELTNLKMIQSWNACVYHFTCVSSRGKDWFKSDPEAKYKNELQSLADQQELKRFFRKWGFFGHHPKPIYNISFNVEIDRNVDFNILKYIEPFCKKLYLSDSNIVDQLINQTEFESNYYANLRWKYSNEHWNSVKHLFNPINFKDRIQTPPNNINEDIIVSFKYSELTNQFTDDIKYIIENIHELIDQNEIGKFSYGPLTIDIKAKNNLMNDYKKVNNTDLLLNSQVFKFE